MAQGIQFKGEQQVKYIYIRITVCTNTYAFSSNGAGRRRVTTSSLWEATLAVRTTYAL